MKRLFSIIMVITLLFVINIIPAHAASSIDNLSEEKTKSFDEKDFKTLNKDEIFERKLEEMNIPSSLHNILRRESYDAICEAETISTVSQYYVESDDSGKLIQTSKADYKKAVIEEKEKIKQREELVKSNRQSSVSLLATRELIASPGITDTINNGTLTMIIVISTSNGTDYTCTGIFEWETLPSIRLKDAFGLTRGSTATTNAQSAYGVYDITYTISQLSGIEYVTNEYSETHNVPFKDLETNETGYAFEYNLPSDISQSEPTYYSITYTHIVGLIQYTGFVNSANITGVNHWTTYAHKKINILINNIDFSIPFGAGFSITFGFTYDELVEEHTWRRNV